MGKATWRLDLVKLLYRFRDDDSGPKLRFDFKADIYPKRWLWWTVGAKEQVFAGRANGLITLPGSAQALLRQRSARPILLAANRRPKWLVGIEDRPDRALFPAA